MFLVSTDGSLLVSPVSLSLSRNALKERKRVEQLMADKYGLEIKCAPFKFVGGQVLQTDKRTIIPKWFADPWTFIVDGTADYRSASARLLGMRTRDYSADNTWLKDEMKTRFGREIEEVPDPREVYRNYGMSVDITSEFYPLRGHLDMIMTPVGENRLLVGDNQKGLEIFRSLDDAEIRPYTQAMTEHLLEYESRGVADAFNSAVHALRSGRTEIPTIIDAKPSDDIGRVTREAEEFCEKHHGSVQRIPALVAPISGIGLAYNNAIVQDATGAKIAIVPEFGIKALDREAHAVFQKHGYRTVPVPFTEISYYGAGPHCMALEIREPV